MKHKCLTCRAVRDSKREIDRHVIESHLPADWTDEDLEMTSEKINEKVELT